MKENNCAYYMGIKESIFITFLLNFVLKTSVLLGLSILIRPIMYIANDYVALSLEICSIVVAWGITIYFVSKYIWEKKIYDRSNVYRITMRQLLIGVISAMGIQLINNTLRNLLVGWAGGGWQYIWTWGYMDKLQPRDYILQVITLCMIAPIAEEYFYRGIILKGLHKKYSLWTSIGISTILFAVMHMEIGAMFFAIPAGILLGYLYLHYNSLGLCMITHACMNIVVVIDPSLMQIVQLFVGIMLLGILVYGLQSSDQRRQNMK